MSTKVWSRFSKQKNGSEIKLKIEEVPPEKYEETFELFLKHFVPEEPIMVASGIPTNAVALSEYKQNMQGYLSSVDHQIDACYVDDDSNKLVGASIMLLKRKNDPEMDPSIFTITTSEGVCYMKLVMAQESYYNVLEEQNLDSFFTGQGLVVHPEYRGLGIAGELLKARVDACKEYKVPATAAWMTAFGTQKAATKLGWENINVLNFVDLEKEADGASFPSGTTAGKLMFARVSV